MKRFSILVLLVLLLLPLTLTSSAAEDPLKLHNVEAKEGEVIYVAVELTQSTVGNTVGIEYFYDEALLDAIPAACHWEKQGVLQHFNADDAGVWTVRDPIELQGTVCILAFRVIADGYFPESEISCRLVVKNTDQEVGVYEATGKLRYRCDHEYVGQWENVGDMGHSKTCMHCTAVLLESHQWIQGSTTNTENPEIQETEFTCVICKAKRYVQSQTGVLPTDPIDTSDPGHTHPSDPSMDEYWPEIPTATTGEINGRPSWLQNSSDGHDHNHDNTSGMIALAVVLVLIAALMGCLAVLLRRRKKKK